MRTLDFVLDSPSAPPAIGIVRVTLRSSWLLSFFVNVCVSEQCQQSVESESGDSIPLTLVVVETLDPCLDRAVSLKHGDSTEAVSP